MTPPAATAAAERGLRRPPAPRVPRRVSGPAPRPKREPGAAHPRRSAWAARLGRVAMRLGDARVLDRLVRGRAWIAIVAVALIGIVFMQVSLLRLNAGISRAVTAADTLERQNSALRADISGLDSGQRVQDVAARLGMVMPSAGAVHYLDAKEADAARAAAAIKAPHPVVQLPGPGTATGASTLGPTGASAGAGTTTGAAATATGTAAVAAQATGSGTSGAATTGTGAGTATGTPTGAATATPTGAATGTAAGTATTPTGGGTATATAMPSTATTTPAGGAAAPQGQGG